MNHYLTELSGNIDEVVKRAKQLEKDVEKHVEAIIKMQGKLDAMSAPKS